MAGGAAGGDCPDISDAAIEDLLASPFQYDYTRITGVSEQRGFIDALDRQLATIEYRRRWEYIAPPDPERPWKSFRNDLDMRRRELFGDRFIFGKMSEWYAGTTDTVIRAFIERYLFLRREYLADLSTVRAVNQLSRRISDRLYAFHFEVDGAKYSANDAARVILSGENWSLAQTLYRLMNDSAAVLAADAANLYRLYNQLGEQKGYPTTIAYHLSRFSFDKPEWLKIADGLKAATEAEYFACLDSLKTISGRGSLMPYEIERMLYDGATLPGVFFPADKVEAALEELLIELGLGDMTQRLTVRDEQMGVVPALAIRLCPPRDILLLKNDQGGLGGFDYYRRLAAEYGRVLPWVYADTALPHLLRDYPQGSEEMLTRLFVERALEREFLARHFDIPPERLDRFEKYHLWMTVFELREVLLFFYFDYYMSDAQGTDPGALFASLEKSLAGAALPTYRWIESLVQGELDAYPERLAYRFSCVKTREILYRRFGEEYAVDTAAGRFLIDSFCRPGATQTIEHYITAHTPDPLSLDDIKRQLKLR